MEGIVEALNAINPLLGVIATLAIAIVGYLIHENRTLNRRLTDVQDREIEGLKKFLGVLESVESFVRQANASAEHEREFRAHCKITLESISSEQKELTELLKNRLIAQASRGPYPRPE